MRLNNIRYPVAHHRLPNYLRTYRRRCGLSQQELALLLGASYGAKISRYENFTRLPVVNTVWACEVVFNQPARELFAGNHNSVRLAVRLRAKRLLKRLIKEAPKAHPQRLVRKLILLRSIVESNTSLAASHD